MEAGKTVKIEGKENDLLERIANDAAFAAVKDKLSEIVNVENFIGFAPEQVDDFIAEVLNPILSKNPDAAKSNRKSTYRANDRYKSNCCIVATVMR